LTTLIRFLNENPGVTIEIRGHTDQIGTKEYNDQLSLLRARSVYQYLIDHGIDAGRLQYHGYGYILPIDTNDTEEGRRLNRRTEFRILENRSP
jgi:outer membrane protein OmpA-like peptidoglycan-associated protein